MKFAVQEQLLFAGKTGNLKVDQIKDDRLLTHQAKKKYMFEADVKGAKALLQQALISVPYSIPAWLSLAELYNDEGDKKRAYQVLQYTDQLTSTIKRWRWDKTLVDYQVGRTDVLPRELGYIIEEIPGKSRRDALQMAFTLWPAHEDLLDNIGHQNIEHLLDYTIKQNLPEKGLFFWQIIEDEGVPLTKKKILRFLNMLLKKGEVRAAGTIWRAHFNSETLLFNQDFNNTLLRQTFGWRVLKSKAYTLKHEPQFKEAPGNLHYRFKGWENLNFHHLYQIVPLEGGHWYEFTGEYKTKKITTDQRPFIEIYGYKCNTPYAKSEMVEPNEDWTRLKVVFAVAKECDAVVVRLRRKESRHIDNKFAGQMWLRHFEILKVDDNFTLFDELSL